jgi:PKD repeat protein
MIAHVSLNLPPTAVIVASSDHGIAPLTVQLDGTASTDPEGGPLSYYWNLSTGEVFGTPTVTKEFTANGVYRVTLVVTDNRGQSAGTTTMIEVTTPNATPTLLPTATPQAGSAPLPVSFRANAYDLNLDPLSYSWTFGDGTTSTEENPTHLFNAAGTYVTWVTVSDGQATASASLTIEVTGPTADAGPDQTASQNSAVVLSGTAFDPDGDLLTYSWAVTTKPEGSAPTLANPDTLSPTFTPDLPGDYTLTLTATDGKTSASDSVVISTLNSAPVADAGPDQSVLLLGTTVRLDGSQSYDPDGNPITYRWAIDRAPVDSKATLSDPTSKTPTFTLDLKGDYLVSLVVSDPWAPSKPDKVLVSFANVPPVASAGPSQTVATGSKVSLAGSGTDANADILRYRWAIAGKPDGSSAELTDPANPATSFLADKTGLYTLTLVVSDGLAISDPSSMTVSAIASTEAATVALGDAVAAIASIPKVSLNNANNANALANKINAALADIAAARYADALAKLQGDILAKTDGCARTGAPDKNDWIKKCADQAETYRLVTEAIEMLKQLI